MSGLLSQPLSQIVTENLRAAAVFEKYGLDFYYRGKRPLLEACYEKQVNPAHVTFDLEEVMAIKSCFPDFRHMTLTALTKYIVDIHHHYIRQQMPDIFNLLLTAATGNGEKYSFIKEVYLQFATLQYELAEHILKEERIVFPRICQLEHTEFPHNSTDYMQAPISTMEHEHEKAGNIMSCIRQLTGNFEKSIKGLPALNKSLVLLKDFETDLHQHIHLENNLLFPRAMDRFRILSRLHYN